MTDTSGKKYKTNDEICAEHGGNPNAFAPIKNGRVPCLRVTLKKNPDAPHVLLVSSEKPKVCEAGRILANQGGSIPLYLKEDTNRWLDLGKFEIERSSQEAAEIEYWQARAGRTDVGLVLFMRTVETELSHAA
jgi:hypothetical protein